MISNNRKEIEALLDWHYASWTRRDPEAVAGCYAEECVFEDVTLQTRVLGWEGVRQFASEIFAAIPEFKRQPTLYSVDGEICSCECVYTGTLTGDLPGIAGNGKRFTVRGLSILVVRDGRIHENRDYWSPGDFVKQLGQPGRVPRAGRRRLQSERASPVVRGRS